jgi:hypothetical protein
MSWFTDPGVVAVVAVVALLLNVIVFAIVSLRD